MIKNKYRDEKIIWIRIKPRWVKYRLQLARTEKIPVDAAGIACNFTAFNHLTHLSDSVAASSTHI